MTTMDSTCTVCDGTGWKIVERAGLSGAERCVCAAATRMHDLKESSNIPPNYEQASLDNFQMPADNPVARQGLGTVLMQVRSFTREFPTKTRPGLLLIGEPGTGKTHLAVAAMRALLDKGHECLFFDYQNLLDRIRSGYDAASGAADREAYRAALDAEVLLLDDLGAHRVTDWVEDTVTAIITHRCNQKKPLIATTNLTDEERVRDFAMPGGEKKTIRERTLAEMIGTRARSRLHEMCRVVHMPTVEDYRVRHMR
jgi:DNA replication protein DnaC